MTDVRFRPLPDWPYAPTKRRRSRSAFSAGWANTLDLLRGELRHLRARNTIIAAGFREDDLRLDGWPRAGARTPAHPGVEISFDSPHGRLVYGTDVCETWQHNVRSIALGLEALRAVDRYGITRRGEQYAGWKQIGAGGESSETRDEAWARKMLHDAAGDARPTHAGWTLADLARAAQRAAHPDAGGSHEQFLLVQEAIRILGAGS